MFIRHFAAAVALSFVSGAASAALPPLLADSAALDRAYIPALMLSNGKDPAKAKAAQEAYEQAWTAFAAKQRNAQPGDAGWARDVHHRRQGQRRGARGDRRRQDERCAQRAGRGAPRAVARTPGAGPPVPARRAHGLPRDDGTDHRRRAGQGAGRHRRRGDRQAAADARRRAQAVGRP
ncbi:MAG: hypothetical protein MZW92_71590 [Comamonadaceae bacterium]|nr:hypothetical protein [Comamonadaceae bacterium]